MGQILSVQDCDHVYSSQEKMRQGKKVNGLGREGWGVTDKREGNREGYGQEVMQELFCTSLTSLDSA